MPAFSYDGHALTCTANRQRVRVEPWGEDGLRVRATPGPAIRDDLPGALLPTPLPKRGYGVPMRAASSACMEVEGDRATIRNGRLVAAVEVVHGPSESCRQAEIRFLDATIGAELLAEESPDPNPEKGIRSTYMPPAREFQPLSRKGDTEYLGDGLYRLTARFRAYPGEHLYGLGQHQHGRLEQKGLTVELRQRNMEVSIPFLLSSRGYGLLWNNPALGRVELGDDGTRWLAEATPQMDYWVTAGAPADILRHYADVTGHVPRLPEWAAGLWQSKLRYHTQEELLAVAREYQRRGLPLAVIVSDALHWTLMGEWQFDPAEWPDPAAMVRELEAMGVRAMVSVWPTVNPLSAHCAHLHEQGWLALTGAADGEAARIRFIDKRPAGWLDLHLLDATHPGARRFLWQRLREGYYRHGIRIFWLDADEPEMDPLHAEDLHLHLGDGRAVANLYPLCHAQGVYEGLASEGETDIITLNRSAWAGSQRYGAAVWSGDIESTWEALRAQVPAGLNIALSGIPWWTTDIGGFRGGDPSAPEFRELLIRWFEYGVFCPLLRLHGFRSPTSGWDTGGPNELWSFGGETYAILREQLFLRERLRPYILAGMQVAHETGLPLMRPLFVDYPTDPTTWGVEDAYLFGADLLVAPLLAPGARARRVYLPAGPVWRDAWTGRVYEGGQWVQAGAPLEHIPLFLRSNADLPIGVL
jgi:alpha-D-xyloside xylohydrolase